MLKNMKLSKKLYLGFGIVLFLLVVVGFISYSKIMVVASEARKMDAISNVQNAIYEARLARYMYSSTGDEAFAQKTEEQLQLAFKLVDGAVQTYPDMKNNQNISEMMTLVSSYQNEFNKFKAAQELKKSNYTEMTNSARNALAEAANSGEEGVAKLLTLMRIDALRFMNDSDPANLKEFEKHYSSAVAAGAGNQRILADLNSYKEDFDKWVNAFNTQVDIQAELVKAAQKAQALSIVVVEEYKNEMDSSISTAVVVIIVFSIAAVALGIFISVLITRSVTVPMGQAIDFAAHLSKGDFSKPLDIKQQDEIGHLASAMEEMRLKLKEIIEGIIMSAGSLASGSTELASTTEELATTFSDQAQQVSSVASAVEEISTSSRLVMDSIHEVSDKSQSAKQLTTEGQNNIVSANEVMAEINKSVGELSTTVAGLAKSSEDIGSILLVINDIADQTNLLALNAAIEAARAGDHGRGFAVVADEVRKLAERTQQSTEEIKTIISQFIKETARTNKEMAEAGRKVQDGANKLDAVDRIFEKIVDSVNEISTASGMITSAVGEQSQAIANINDNAQVISSGLEQSTAAITQVSHTVADLQKQADDQMEGTRIFKI
ncbi:methyl-accepting chemotaxis protein [Seleniivibrio woodruffii]|uniref:Methyl-accepting chemotaxis protein n=2 Tax=Seleniivibrio woodruffii TaxID=1078050 RepID=A0A4R1KGY9_9BACT|nr:methyl-accepting chemotaxis protein [Seleniivibrio woodruffii]TCK62619.1 methyl-accepting chemotaxis protein [Seleniivibrio woodruffii]TVZ36955.1 methyl-accepting chemotaxis protein [Seleniivibrio woodruffii]